jgi:hypothetical protein
MKPPEFTQYEMRRLIENSGEKDGFSPPNSRPSFGAALRGMMLIHLEVGGADDLGDDRVVF